MARTPLDLDDLVEHWTLLKANRQVRRSGLCTSCWMRESEPDILCCDGGKCRNFTRLLQLFA